MKANRTNDPTAMTSGPGVRNGIVCYWRDHRWNASKSTLHRQIDGSSATPIPRQPESLGTGRAKRVEPQEAEVDALHHGNRRDTTEPQSGSVQQRCK